MLAAGVLLLILGALQVHGSELDLNETQNALDDNEWLFKLLEATNECEPDPCHNGGSCQRTEEGFQCDCVEPYMGSRCQKVRNICANETCGHGECVINLSKHPFFECSCRSPYFGSDCNSLPTSVCEPNPCQNGGICTADQPLFHCTCADGFQGELCDHAPTDCYTGNGETYKGVVSTTEDGEECLNWRSNFIFLHMGSPMGAISAFLTLENNNHCRNSDGDDKPWCFVKKGAALDWHYCNVTKCSEDPVTPTIDYENTTSEQFVECGIRAASNFSRIYWGSKALAGANPWQVSVQVRPRGSPFGFSHICGGILISSCWVLTAGHCIQDMEYQVAMGGVNIRRRESIDQIIPVLETIRHEDYKRLPQAVYNDIALLHLQVTEGTYCAKETPYVRAACLPEQIFPSGSQCVISGWGATQTQSSSAQLLNAQALLISDELCRLPYVYGDIVDESMLCAGTLKGGVDSCQGDSGGPLICQANGTHYVSGVVSWGYGCGKKNKPGVYANVIQFVDWINEKIHSSR